MNASPLRPSTIATMLLSIAVLSLLVGVQSVCADTYLVPTSSRAEHDLSGAWKFYKRDVSDAHSVSHDDSSWGAVDLPHTWNAISTDRTAAATTTAASAGIVDTTLCPPRTPVAA